MALAGAGWWIERQSMSKPDLAGDLSQRLRTGLAGVGPDRLEGRATLPDGRAAPPEGNVTRLPHGRLGTTSDG
jgi:hypothetical protein